MPSPRSSPHRHPWAWGIFPTEGFVPVRGKSGETVLTFCHLSPDYWLNDTNPPVIA
jgi:hypothetical protein